MVQEIDKTEGFDKLVTSSYAQEIERMGAYGDEGSFRDSDNAGGSPILQAGNNHQISTTRADGADAAPAGYSGATLGDQRNIMFIAIIALAAIGAGIFTGRR